MSTGWARDALRLRNSGWTFQAVGDAVGVSRERVGQVIGRGRLPLVPKPISLERQAHAQLPCSFDGCVNLIGSTNRVRRYCSEHMWSYSQGYRNWSATRRAHHKALVSRWQGQHPERYREIQRRATRAYYARKHPKEEAS